MNYTAEQLEAIKLFGRKDLTEGCYFSYRYLDEVWIEKAIGFSEDSFPIKLEDYRGITWSGKFKILGHIPHLEDLFRVAEEKGIYVAISPEITRVYKEFGGEPIEIVLVPTLPILDQPSLPEIISLFK